MGRYVVLYSAPLSVKQRFAQATPEEAMKGMGLWVDWAKRLGPALLDAGKPFGNATQMSKAGAEPVNSEVVGMSILEAGSMEAALGMVENHHHLDWSKDCEITVLEEIPIPEMAGAAPH